MTRYIYACADDGEVMFTDSEHYGSFHQIASLLQTACNIDPELVGREDIEIEGKAIDSFKALVLTSLEENIASLEPDPEAHVKYSWRDGTIKLNRRNSKHSIIFRLFSMLDMANAESEKGGAIHFYSLAALDNTNTYIAKTFKAEKNGIGMAAAFAKFTTAYEQYSAMQQQEFEERVQQLITGGFLQSEENGGSALWYPTVKANTIKII